MAQDSLLAMLQSRDIGFATTSNLTCARPLPNEVGNTILGSSSLTFQHLMVFISAACLGITILSTLFLNWRHLRHYTVPQEQRQILRIINLPAAYGIFNFLALAFPMDYQYIAPIAGVYEAFCVAALFLLGLEYVCPDGTDRETYFNNLPGRDKKGKPVAGGSLQWFQRTFGSVLQYPLTKTIFTIIQITTQFFHVYCENSFSPKYAHIWLTIADFLFIGGALGATIKFFQRMGAKEHAIDRGHGAKAKIWAFIGILIFQMLQDLIFGLLNGKLFSPSAIITYNDINFGVPALLTCVEAFIFSLIFHWSYSSKEYQDGHRLNRLGGVAQRTSTLKAILDALNPSDIIVGTTTAVGLLFMRVQSRYGARAAPQREKLMGDSNVGMEPLSYSNKNNNSHRMRGYSGGSDPNEQSPPLEDEYEGGLYEPAVPNSTRDPSAKGRARSQLRPAMGGGQEYQPLTRSRDPSPSGAGAQYPRAMV
ncbi:hypothetical protein LTR91_014958 [Friedmanniomyces endolithicus]|uniref:DUF300-domain-containing protein n=1 Tax=Friedmanniomyces endolithicus TaxID=329885 RepID=A0A4U0TM07_9PEZI|nr:hypothetical protein LTS09_016709 [Friedmanniomyces endolithicus]KAK0283235.1 hypothetical protein LTR35_006308 [Friedmanniomyces endolithicus]KAK0298501.1 hypothetical protein LTS00_002882 [Friedmanniomyces endolithicus]KAK0327659.1 hypothetical protein LTR82_001175 [Friedmanniomyces endolithicus]KAK0922530.1 hypothetical protein LTR57_007770 [Friedmanniomyces endolithicus]